MTRAALVIAACAACGRIDFAARTGDAKTLRDATPTDAVAGDVTHEWRLDEAVGATTAIDVQGADATLVAPAAFTTAGHDGNGLASGSGGYATISSTPNDLLGLTAVTLSAWMRRAAPGAVEQVGQEVTPGGDELSLQAWNDGDIYFCVGTPGACGTTPTGNDTSWHLVTMVFDGSQASDATRLIGYVDGVAQSLTFVYTLPVPSSTPTVTGHFDLGAVSDNEGDDTGTLDDVRVYTRALAPAEVSALFAGT